MDAATFRAALGQWPTGVTLVTTAVDGQWYGVTASSFSSVSLDPPLVSVCLARSAFAHDLVLASGAFGVTILAKDQAELGQRFARFEAGVDRFEGASWETASTGSPLLSQALGWLDCVVEHAYSGGDHTIFVGRVESAATPRTTSHIATRISGMTKTTSFATASANLSFHAAAEGSAFQLRKSARLMDSKVMVRCLVCAPASARR